MIHIRRKQGTVGSGSSGDAGDRPYWADIQRCLKTELIGNTVYGFEELDSTNARAFELAELGAKEGTVVLAERQTKGRGRLGRAWHSPPGLGIWMSIVLRPKIMPAVAPGLSLVAGVTLARTIEKTLGLTAELRWPNDCLLGEKKVAGILAELSADRRLVKFVILGMGINILHRLDDFPADVRKSATSLALAAGRPVDRADFLRASLRAFEKDYLRFKECGLAAFIKPYTTHCRLIGCRVRARVGQRMISGTAVRLDQSGALVIAQDGEETVLTAGEITRIR